MLDEAARRIDRRTRGLKDRAERRNGGGTQSFYGSTWEVPAVTHNPPTNATTTTSTHHHPHQCQCPQAHAHKHIVHAHPHLHIYLPRTWTGCKRCSCWTKLLHRVQPAQGRTSPHWTSIAWLNAFPDTKTPEAWPALPSVA